MTAPIGLVGAGRVPKLLYASDRERDIFGCANTWWFSVDSTKRFTYKLEGTDHVQHIKVLGLQSLDE